MIITEKRKKRKNKNEVITLTIDPVETNDKAIISEELIASLIKNGNTVLTYFTYHRLMCYIWNNVLLNAENIFDCDNETDLMLRTYVCHKRIEDIFKERTGFKVTLRYVYNAYGLQSVEKAQLGNLNRSAYFIIEKVPRNKIKNLTDIPENRTYMAYQEGKKVAARQLATDIKRNCTLAYGGKLCFNLGDDMVKIIDSPDDLASYVLEHFSV